MHRPKAHIDRLYVKGKEKMVGCFKFNREVSNVAEFRNKNIQKTSLQVSLKATKAINQIRINI